MDLHGINKTVTTNLKNGGQRGRGLHNKSQSGSFINPDLGGRKGALRAPLRPDKWAENGF